MNAEVRVEAATFASGVSAESWRDAVRAAGLDLVNAAAVGPAYIDEMVQLIENSGPYCVVAPHVAVPHSNAGSLVRQSGMAVVVLDEPVTFGHPYNDPVRVVIAIAARTAKQHITMLAALANALDRPGAVKELIAASDKDAALKALRASVRTS
ncbi:MAG TPA: PTS sugar transporter subunit IIA [Candidatus Agrococcus pullicola]|uniref:Ascorbate-specific PTS system EIIA component n=1 Tax=Candidatus Agrococcus pullicola TaxID=2838429 RepID=A0A9D1YVW0_9MICO|nr:PTS sugar transporter subunit IIA [Candidatus Agrococcus pullicola]